MSANAICCRCARKAETNIQYAEKGQCVKCGAMKPRSKFKTSPYCQPCTNEVSEQSRVCSRQVKRAIKAGVIPVLDGSVECVDCGMPAKDYDHRDYTKPLDVAPVCRGCNIRRGPAEKFAAKVGANDTAKAA